MNRVEVMPRSTAKYPFEYKLLEAASNISIRLNGELRTYLILFDEQGNIRQVSFERVKSTWFEEVDQLRIHRQPHFFFDPFDVPEHTWVSWLAMKRSMMEHLMGTCFQEEDFKSMTTPLRSDELGLLSDFPTVWEVMF